MLAWQQMQAVNEQEEEPQAPTSALSAETFGVAVVGVSGVGKTVGIEHLACNLLVSPNEYGRLHSEGNLYTEDGLEAAQMHK